MALVDGHRLLKSLKSEMSGIRGNLTPNSPMSAITWFRVGGPAELLFQPQDEHDLSLFLKKLPTDIPVFVIGAGSNLLVRDGGIPGVVTGSAPRASARSNRFPKRALPQVRPVPTSGLPRLHRRTASAGCTSIMAFPVTSAAH